MFCECEGLFGENYVEENEIYFGFPPNYNEIDKLNFTGYSGYLRNLIFQSCGCKNWKNINFIENHKVLMNEVGKCGINNGGCGSNCACLTKEFGDIFCNCQSQSCVLKNVDNALYYNFDMTSSITLNQPNVKLGEPMRLHSYSGGHFRQFMYSSDTPHDDKAGGQSILFGPDQWMILEANVRPSCFKKIFVCDKNPIYSFWLKLTSLSSHGVIFQHQTNQSTSSKSFLVIEIIYNSIQVTFQMSSNKYVVSQIVYINIWSHYAISINQTRLCLYHNNIMQHKCTKISSFSQLSHLSTRYLQFGHHSLNSTADFIIDSFRFNTKSLTATINTPKIIDIMLIQKRYYENIMKYFKNSDFENYCKNNNQIINNSSFYKCQFTNSQLPHLNKPFMGLYFNLIFTISARTAGILVELENVFKIEKLYLDKKLMIKLSLQNRNGVGGGGGKEINELIPISNTNCGDDVCHLELEIDKNGSFQVWLNLISKIWYKSNLVDVKEMEKLVSLKVVVDHELLWKFRILNLNRKAGVKLGIIITDNFYQSTLDFDRTNVTEYGSSVNLVDGFIDKALNLSVNNKYTFRKWFENSCVRMVESCYFGITMTFWLIISNESLSNLELISTGKNGLKVEINTQQIILYYKNMKSTFHNSPAECFNGKWCFMEIGIFNQLGLVELFVNQQERNLMVTVPSDWSKGSHHDQIIVGPANGVLIDEIRVADVDRRFLYANGYISRGPTNYKLLSFTRYQQKQLKQYKLHGSANLVHTDFGQGLSLSQFGHRWATVAKYSSANNLQRRGWMVRLWLRPDNVGQSRQVWLDIPWLHLLLESDMEYLVGTYKSMLSRATMVISSRTVLNALQWTLVELSWRQDDGLRMIVNGRLIGHSRSISKSYRGLEDILGKEDESFMTLGSINFPASGIIDDLEIFDADRTNLAYDRYLLDDVWCTAKEDFNRMSKLHFGVVGTGHCTTNQNVSTNNVLVTLPNCFDKTTPVTGCRNCWSIRFWLLLLDMINNVILTTTSSTNPSQLIRISVILKGFSLELGNLHFWCELSGSMEKIMKKWRFIEISWDEDEGVLLFIDRALIECECLARLKTNIQNDPLKLGPSLILFPFTIIKQKNQADNTTSSAVGGCIDELEVYRNRLSILYRTSVINDEFVRSILRDIRDRELLRQRIETLLIMKEKGKGNVWKKKQDNQLQFVGDRHGFVKYDIKYDSYSDKYPLILSTQQVNIVFSVDRLGSEEGRGCVLWANEYDHPPITSLLLLKKDFLVFSRSYSVSGFNETRFVTEEIQIKERIVVGLIYEVVIIYQFDKISVDVKLFKAQNATNTTKSREHIIARQKPLLPNKSVVFLGGYKQYMENINSSFAGTIYEASINTHELEPSRDLKLETITSLKSKTRSKVSPQTVGNIRIVHKTLTKPIDVEMRDLVNSLTQDPVTLKFTSPFNQLKLVFRNFSQSSFLSDLTGDIRFKFSTYYSRGLIFLMGNVKLNYYLALEIFDSELYIVYKSCLNNSAIFRQSIQRRHRQQQHESLGRNMKYRKRAIYTVIIYKDVSGSYNLLVNEVLVLRKICLLVNNQSISFGYYGDGVNDWPAEIYSRIGFVGCLLYIKLGDVGYVNITQKTITSFVEYNPLNQSISTHKSLIKPCNQSKSDPPNECLINNQVSNQPCRGGFCRPMEYLSSEILPQLLLNKINLNLVQCDCVSSARHRDSGFLLDSLLIRDITPIEITEYNGLLWLIHQLVGRDLGMGSCSADDTNFYISQSSSIKWTYTNSIYVPNTFDMEFSIKTYLSSDNQNVDLIAKLVFKSNWFIVVFHESNHSIGLKLFHGLIEQSESHISIGQMLAGIWHIIRIQIRCDRISLLFDTFTKDFNLTRNLPPIKDVIIGGSPETLSNTWVRKVTINAIPIVPQLQNLNLTQYFILSYINYIQPQLSLVQSIKSITLLNNHKSTIMKPQQPFTLQSSLITQLSITLPYIDVLGNYSLLHITTTNHYSLFIHLSNHNPVVQLHCLYITTIAQMYQIIPLNFYKSNSSTQLWITINLIANNINITLITSGPETVLDSQHYLLTNKIQDFIWPLNQSMVIILGSLDNNMPSSVYGCIKLLTISNVGRHPTTNNQYRLIHNPLNSVVIGQCKNVSRCNVNSCDNNDICYHDDGYTIKCRCVHRNSIGTRQYKQTTILPISTTTNNVTTTNTIVKTVTPDHPQVCSTQYYGRQCNWRGLSQCTANQTHCYNRGLCYFNAATNKSLCNCELTLFRGSHCHLDEIGFNPSQNGVVVMTQPPPTLSSSGEYNYDNNDSESFRMLLQIINETDKSQNIMTYRGINGIGFRLLMINNTLNLIGSINQHNLIGYMKNTNILLITYDMRRIKYLFNGKYEELQWKSKPNQIYRFRRDIRTSQIVRETNIGCDKLSNECFHGLIGGFTWNNKSFLDPSNSVVIKGDIKNISNLILIKFPQIYVADKSETNYWRYFFVFLLAAAGLLILSLVIAMLILILKYKTKLHTKRRKSFFVSTTSHSNHNINNIRYNDESNNIELEPMIKPNHFTAIENASMAKVSKIFSPDIKNNKNNQNLYKQFDQLPSDDKIDLINPSGSDTIQKKLILIKQANQIDLSSLQCYDLLVLPHTGDLMVIVDMDCNFQNCELFYPTISDGYECHRVNMTSDHKYIFASVTSPSSTNRNEYLLLTWSLTIRPSNGKSSLATYENCQIASVPPFIHAVAIDNYQCSTIILTIFADYVVSLCIFDLSTNTQVTHSTMFTNELQYHNIVSIKSSIDLNYILLIMSSPTYQIMVTTLISNKVSAPLRFGSPLPIQLAPVRQSIFYILLNNNQVIQVDVSMESPSSLVYECVFDDVIQMISGITNDDTRRIALLMSNLTIKLNLNTNLSSPVWLHLTPAVSNQLHQKDVVISFSADCSKIFRLYNRSILLNVWSLLSNESTSPDLVNGICKFYRVPNSDVVSNNVSLRSWCSIEYIKCYEMVMILTNIDNAADCGDDHDNNSIEHYGNIKRDKLIRNIRKLIIKIK